MGGRRMDSAGSEYQQVVEPCEHDNEPLGSVKFWEYFEHMSNY
jgi:hypothetical protein